MTRLTDILQINISRATTAVSRASFSIPCFIAAHTAFSERAKVYASVDAVALDFLTTSNTYKAAEQYFGQSVSPNQIVIGRRQVDSVNGSVATVANTTLYTVTINGVLVSYTSDATATAIEIATGLKAAFDLLTIAGVTFTDHLDGTFTIANSVAGTALTVKATTNLNLVDVAPTETWADTLAAVRAVNDTWYIVSTEDHTDAGITNISAYIETQKKLYAYSSASSAIAGSGTTDIASVLMGLARNRTFGMYSVEADTQFPECAWVGALIVATPGSADWTYKQLTGVTPDAINDTASQNMHGVQGSGGKNITTYESVGGVSATVGGNVASGEKIDVMIGVDWLETRLRERIWSKLVNAKKISYTAAGSTVIEAEIRAQLAEGINNDFLSATPAPVVNMPNVLSQSTNNRANRIYNGITFSAQLAGAIRFIGISGTVTV